MAHEGVEIELVEADLGQPPTWYPIGSPALRVVLPEGGRGALVGQSTRPICPW